jgi:Domain of unknown function (DUF929)
MGKADRNRQQNARARIAAQQAAARRAEARRRMLIAGGSVLAVIAVVVAFVIIRATSGASPGGTGPATGTALPASVNAQITGVPASTLAAVGKGTVFPKAITPINGAPLTSNGKPEVLYIGAEFCPYCATERWPMAIALSRFGTFSPLRGIHSSSTDIPASIPTLTFYKSTYTSKYLTFVPVETTTTDKTQPLQVPTSAQTKLWQQYDQQTIPFVDFGNKYVIGGVSYAYQLLQGRTWSQIAAALSDPSNPIAQGAVGSANMITAAICKITNNQPATVCDAAPVTSLQSQL